MASPAYAATVGKEHVCKVIGDDNPNNGSPYHEAVVCTDLLQYDAGGGLFSAGSRIEAFCQTSTGITLRCAGIAADTEVAWAAAVNNTVAWNGVCGAVLNRVFSACPAGRFYVTVPDTIPLPTGSCLRNVWRSAYGTDLKSR